MKRLASLTIDQIITWATTIGILAEIGINYVTSYGHIYILGLHYGEYGVDARLNPIAIDLVLLVLSLVNLYLARKGRRSPQMRFYLAMGVGATVAANAAYGALWGYTGGLLAVWSPVALFVTVEAGMLLLRVTAEEADKAARELKNSARAVKAATTRSSNKDGAPRKGTDWTAVPGAAVTPELPPAGPGKAPAETLSGIGLRMGV